MSLNYGYLKNALRHVKTGEILVAYHFLSNYCLCYSGPSMESELLAALFKLKAVR